MGQIFLPDLNAPSLRKQREGQGHPSRRSAPLKPKDGLNGAPAKEFLFA
jgi:hypothetical protein